VDPPNVPQIEDYIFTIVQADEPSNALLNALKEYESRSRRNQDHIPFDLASFCGEKTPTTTYNHTGGMCPSPSGLTTKRQLDGDAGDGIRK